MTEFLSLEALAARIPDGSLLAIPPDHVGVAMAATRALLRRGARGLRLLTVPTSGLQADLLIGAGAVAEIETAGVMLGEAGSAGRFTAAIKAGSIVIRDATCPAIHAGLQAAEKGIPFMPLRGILGQRPDRAPAGLADHGQSLWQCRSPAAPAGARARYRALPCPASPIAPAMSGSDGGASWSPWRMPPA